MKTNARRMHSNIEMLESRIAPATFTLIDLNGDKIHFTSSSHLLTSSYISEVNIGDADHYGFVVNILDASFNDSSLTVTVTKVRGGDGQTYIGINAGTNNLGNINIEGDLGMLTAGSDAMGATAINSLAVNSIGRFPSVPLDSLVTSHVSGSIKKLTVRGDMDGTYLSVSQNIGSIFVGGSVIGGDFSNDGKILAGGTIGSVVIKHDLRGGAGFESGSIFSTGDMGSIAIGGSIYGGYGNYSGLIGTDDSIKSVIVSGSIYGSIGKSSGEVQAGYSDPNGVIGTVTISGSLVGGGGTNSGAIGNGGGTGALSVTNAVIGGNIIGGGGQYSGSVYATDGSIGRLTVKGSVFGGQGSNTGFISSSDADGTIVIDGSVFGGYGGGSGYIALDGGLQTFILGGSLLGGFGPDSGDIALNTGMVGHLMRIDGDVRGSIGLASGSITTGGGVAPVVLGEIFAGSGTDSGVVVS